MVTRIKNGLLDLYKRISMHHLFSFAATSAYFILLSLIPFILILLVCVRFTSISETEMMNYLINTVPTEFESFISMIVKEVYNKSLAVVPISVIVALWSAAKGLHALTYGLNTINNVAEEKNWFFIRFRSMLYTFILILAVVLVFILMIFGKRIEFALQAKLLLVPAFLKFILSNRAIFMFILLTVLFLAMYVILPDKKVDIISQLPGALLVSLAWSLFSWIMSMFYADSALTMYGSLSALIAAMIWMYFCMYFFLIGAELNYVLSSESEDNMILDTVRDVAYLNYIKKEKKSCHMEFESLKKLYGSEVRNREAKK